MESLVYVTEVVIQKQHAQNKDGVWYSRKVYTDPRLGIKYTPWVKSLKKPKETTESKMMKIRLPKG